MKKNFNIPVSFECTSNEQFERLGEELLKIGYLRYDGVHTNWCCSNKYITTKYAGSDNTIGFFNSDFDHRGFLVQSEEVFLALASMTSNEEFFVGESIIRLKNEHGILKVGDLGIIINITNKGHDFAITIQNDEREHMHSSDNIRKATKEEIINHFFNLKNKTETMSTNSTNSTSTEQVLPEMWVIKSNPEIFNEIQEVFNIGNRIQPLYCYGHSYENNYFYSHNISDRSISIFDRNPKSNYAFPKNNVNNNTFQEINIETFRKIVKLKVKNKMEKEIIGYKLKEDCRQFEKAAFAVINANSVEGKTKFDCKVPYIDFTDDSKYCTWLKEANVLDLWFQPVYEDIKKDVQVSVRASKTLVFTISKDHEGYVKENQENKKVSIVSLANMVTNGFKLDGYYAYKVIPVTFSMGCVKNIYTSDIEKVIEAYDKFWGTSHLDLPF